MKNFSVNYLIMISILLCGVVNAQGVAFGLKAGSNVSSQIEYPSEFEGTPILRPMAGIYFRLPISDRVQIQPEAILSFQGLNTSINATDGLNSIQLKSKDEFTYINVPIITRVMLRERFALEFGPQIGYFLGGNTKGTFTENLSAEESFDEELTSDDINEIDISGVAGLSYEMPNGFGINLRVQYGVSNVYKESEDLKDYLNVTNNKNVLAQLGVTYTIPLKK